MLLALVDWAVDYFVVTSHRFILTSGLFNRKVAMMPLVKVTDMTFQRSFLGRILGYGTFILESAGQDQALSTVDYIPYPEQLYLRGCADLSRQRRRRPTHQDLFSLRLRLVGSCGFHRRVASREVHTGQKTPRGPAFRRHTKKMPNMAPHTVPTAEPRQRDDGQEQDSAGVRGAAQLEFVSESAPLARVEAEAVHSVRPRSEAIERPEPSVSDPPRPARQSARDDPRRTSSSPWTPDLMNLPQQRHLHIFSPCPRVPTR